MPRGVYKRKPMALVQRRKLAEAAWIYHRNKKKGRVAS